MKEVKMMRYAGPFEKIPYKYYIQSPIGLVPKAGGQTRLIFHLSYKFKSGGESINFWTPKEICLVKYQDLDHAIRNCLTFEGVQSLFFGKTDLKNAFRVVPMKVKYFKYLILKAENPKDGRIYYFIDKCMPFGASISCSHFQRLSNALRHIVEFLEKIKNAITNYLDDFLFIHYLRHVCNRMIRTFMKVCDAINFPMAVEKTEWAGNIIIFLGMMLNRNRFIIQIPEDKVHNALNLISRLCEKKKATVKELQQLTGTLNFFD